MRFEPDRLRKMTTKLLLYAALLTASGGLAFAAIRILRTNRSIATVWPDWEGIKSTATLWITLALALCLSIATAFIPEKLAEIPKIPKPQTENPKPAEQKELAKLRNQITQLKQQLAESAQTQPTTISLGANPTKDDSSPEKPRQTSAKTTPSPQQQSAQPTSPPSPAIRKTAPPPIEQLRQTLIQSLITGSTKSLETVAHKSLLNLLANQLTVNPFHYSNLQSSLKYRLRNGYNPVYLDTLNTANGTTHLWKIKTTAPGPDILQKLTVFNGKITAFHFDNLR